jgi:hypothetical protein
MSHLVGGSVTAIAGSGHDHTRTVKTPLTGSASTPQSIDQKIHPDNIPTNTCFDSFGAVAGQAIKQRESAGHTTETGGFGHTEVDVADGRNTAHIDILEVRLQTMPRRCTMVVNPSNCR